MSDYVVRGIAYDNQVRFFAVSSTDTVEEARRLHETSPEITMIMSDMLSAGIMMGNMLKNEKDSVTLRINCEGPAEAVIVSADSKGGVRGVPANPKVSFPKLPDGRVDLSLAIVGGNLNVIKDEGTGQPYVGTCDFVSTSMAKNLTWYFVQSEQTPSAVGLGVIFNEDYSVKSAGGFIIQMLPNASEEVISKLEENLKKIGSVDAMLSEGLTPEEMIKRILGDNNGAIFYDKVEAGYRCSCSHEKTKEVLMTLPKTDIEDMIYKNTPAEAKCHFCGRSYTISVDELKEIVKKMPPDNEK